jgi:hypothetical protein
MRFRFLMIGFLCLSILSLTEISVGARVITQGAYAQVLCKWLFRDGVRMAGDGTDMKASVLALATLGIEAQESWQADQPISDSDIAVIVKSVIMSTRSRHISCTPERGVDLVAATSIELGLSGRDVYLMAFPIMGWTWSPFVPRSGGTVRGGTIPTIEEATDEDVTSNSQ